MKDISKKNMKSLFDSLGIRNVSGWPDTFGQKCREWAVSFLKKPIKILSLFSGAGGLDIGFHDVGFSIQACIEIEKKFVNTLIENSYPKSYLGENCRIVCDDIRNYHPPETLKVDFIIGGPPCQTFSAAGRRVLGVIGTDDARGMLFKEYIRLLNKIKPRGFLFENVYGIIGAQGGTPWKKIQKAFSNAGYHLFHRILDAADYGVPQFRERLIIVGLREGEYKFPRPTHGPDSNNSIPYFTAEEAILTAPESPEKILEGIRGRYGNLLKDIPPGLNYSFYTKEMGHPHPIFAWRSKFSDFLYKADPNTPVRTLKAQGGQYTGPFHWENRIFSINELKRLQTFPDNYAVTGTRIIAIKQLGNSVPPQLARVLALSILNQVFKKKLPFEMSLLKDSDLLSFRRRKFSKTKLYREKARSAIKTMTHSKTVVKFTQKKYRFQITKKFELKESEDGYLTEIIEEKNGLMIKIKAEKSSSGGFLIDINPIDLHKWTVKYKKIRLQSDVLEYDAFLIAWKFFEKILIDVGEKADLVQLIGYYQYSPSFHSTMTFKKKHLIDKKWSILSSIISGQWCRYIYSSSQLACGWNINSSEVLKFAQFLKTIGYEIRNAKTNPQVPADHYLIPYPFPTLNKMSVQLRKVLT